MNLGAAVFVINSVVIIVTFYVVVTLVGAGVVGTVVRSCVENSDADVPVTNLCFVGTVVYSDVVGTVINSDIVGAVINSDLVDTAVNSSGVDTVVNSDFADIIRDACIVGTVDN